MTAAFPQDRLDAYKVALEFIGFARSIAEELPRGFSDLADQLRRAGFSVALNTAEGAAEFQPREKARFYRMALRSAAECAAVLDVLARYEVVSTRQLEEGRAGLSRVVAMLTRLANGSKARAPGANEDRESA